MSVLGSVAIEVGLDEKSLDRQLELLEKRKIKPLRLKVELDAVNLQQQTKQLSQQLDPIKVDLSPNVEDFQKKLKKLGSLVDCIPIKLCPDVEDFHKKLKQLPQKLDPIKVDLSPNVQDFQDKLRRLGRISPIDVEVRVDKRAVKAQFEEIGRYASEGFAQGFLTEDVGKSAAESLVRNVKQQLGIQSPSKVFRQIGKYSIDGLMEGLKVDSSEIKSIVNDIENQFRNSRVQISLDIDKISTSGKLKVQTLASQTEKTTDFTKNITKSIEEGFQKAKPKANFLGAIFGGVGSLVSVPLAAAFRGVFEGIGTPLGLQMGTGVSKAIQSTLGQNIGSLELVSQKAIEKSLQAIPDATEAIVETIKANPIGNAVVKQLELLQRTLDLYNINLSPQKAVQSLATDQERAVASSSATFESQQSEFKSRKKAKASASNEFVSLVGRQGEIDKISQLIKQKEQDLTAKLKKLQLTQDAIASLEARLQKIAELPQEQRAATEAPIRGKITELSEILEGGNASIEQDTKDIASLGKVKLEYFEKLSNQIKILANLGIETDLSSQSAVILKGVEVFEQMAVAQKALQEAQKNTKTNAKTPETIRNKKLDKLTTLADSAKDKLDKTIVLPDATPAQIQKLKKRSAAANKALELYKLELADPAKEIEKINQKLANGRETLAKNIQELQARLTQAIPALFREASHEVVKVSNLGEIAPQKPKSLIQEQKEYYSETAILQREQGKKKEQEIKRTIANSRSETELPREYREIVKDVANLYAGLKVKSKEMPSLKASGTQEKLGYSGQYDPKKNQVLVSDELFSRALTGSLTSQDISTLTHEIIHAIDYGFGKKTQIDAASSIRNIQPTVEELRIEGARIEGSTRFEDAEKNYGQSRDLSRTLETNAYIGDLRLSPEILKCVEKRRAIHNFETEFGRGAPLAVNQFKELNASVISTASQKPQELLTRQKAILQQGSTQLKSLIDKARESLHILPTEEIIELQLSIRKVIADSIAAIQKEETSLLEGATEANTSVQKELEPVVKDIPNIELPIPTSKSELQFNSSGDVRAFATENLNARGVKDLARRMGIDTKNANKEFLINEIAAFGGTFDSRQQIAQLTSQLSPDKFLANSQVKGKTSSLPEAQKAISDLKKSRKALADALKLAQELDEDERQIVLESVVETAREQEAIAKSLSSEYQLTPAQSKSLGGVKTQFKNISDQAKIALTETKPQPTGQELGANLVNAIGSGMINATAKPVKEAKKVMAAIETAAKDQAEIKSPSRVFQRIGKFLTEGLSIGIGQGAKSTQDAISSVIKGVEKMPQSVGKLKISNDAANQVKKLQEETRKATENFQKLFPEVVKMAGIDPVTVKDKIPRVAFLDLPGTAGNYESTTNRIALSQNTRKRLASGNLIKDDIDTIAHEIRHAIQMAFGNLKLVDFEQHKDVPVPLMSIKDQRAANTALTSTNSYAENYKKRIGLKPSNQHLKTVYDLEADAVAFAAQVAGVIHKNIKAILKAANQSPSEVTFPPPPKTTLPPPPPPPWEMVKAVVPYESKLPALKPKTTLPPPPPPPWEMVKSLVPPPTKTTLPPPPPPPWEMVKAVVPYESKLPALKPKTTLPPPPPPPWEMVKAVVPYESKLPALKPKTTLPPPPPPPWEMVKSLVPPPTKTTLPPPPPPPWKMVKSLVPVSPKPPVTPRKSSPFPIPPSPAQVDPKFGLPIKLRELFDRVVDTGELLKIVSDIQKDQTKGLEKKLKEYDQIVQIYDDLEAEKLKDNQALDDKFSPDKIDQQRETIRQRAKLSANLERKYGMEGLAPEILPERIQERSETAPSPSIFQSIKDVFKSFDNSIAKRVKKRAAQLAIEVDTAIAPSLETGAIAAQQRGDKAEQKQYQKLAKQARATTKGIAKILDSSEELTPKQVKQLDRLTQQLEKVYDAIGRPLPSQGFLESFGIGLSGLSKNLGGFIKGAIAFAATSYLQNFFQSIAKDSFLAYVELNRLKTALNFASGGSAGGAQNLAFVRKTVDDLKIPLKASTEGFTKLESSARGSALAGKDVKELFKGLSQASTVLSLSAEETQGITTAISQSISKGKLLAEEQNQLAERIPGIFGIMARAAGVTEAEFTRLRDAGQVLSVDFFPKFGRQLQAEFGDAAKDAAGNAQSAIYDLENSFLSLQQGIGEGVSPAAILGLNTLSGVVKGLNQFSKELGFSLLAVSSVLAIKMVGALQAVVAELIATKMATGTLSGGMAQLGRNLNNSASVQWAVGIFAALELVNLLNQAINTELVQSFDKAAKAARRGAEESRKAFEKPANGKAQGEIDPEASSGFGKFGDSLINFLNKDLGPIKGGLFGNKIKTWGEYERDSIINDIEEQGQALAQSNAETRYRIAELKTGKGEAGKLRGIDSELKTAEEERAILQARIKREFTDKGQVIPSELKQQLESQNLKITQLNNQRSEIATPLTLELNRKNQEIAAIQSNLELLQNPEKIKTLGGEAVAEKQRQELRRQLESHKLFRDALANTLASLRVDPILAFNQALRQLNLTLAEGQEKNKLTLSKRKLANTREAITGFSSNKLAARQLALKNANDEFQSAQTDVNLNEKAVAAYEQEINKSGFQATLQRLGLTPDASVSKIDDVLKYTTDEADKGTLEKLKAGRESKANLIQVQQTAADAKQRLNQQIQDNSLFNIDESTASSRARITKSENRNIAQIKNAQAAKRLTDEVVAEELAKIQLTSTQQQKASLNEQLTALRTYYKQGAISAEEFAKRERDLTTEQTNIERQEAENRLAVQQALQARRIKDLEFANKKAEAAITLSQTTSNTAVKLGILGGDLDSQQASQEQNKIDQKATTDKIALINQQITQTKKLRQEGLLNAREAAEKELSLNQELSQSNQQLVDQQIQAQEQLRAAIDKAFQRRKQQLDLENSRRDTNTTAEALAIFKSSSALDLRGLELSTSGKSLKNKQAYLASKKSILEEELAGIDKLKLSEQDAADKKRQLLTEIDRFRRDQIATEKELIQNKQEQEINGIERLQRAEENRYKLVNSYLDEQKAKLDLYNQSLDRTKRLEESRYKLNKSLSDAAVFGLESQQSNADDALGLLQKLKDPELAPQAKAAIKAQLGELGFSMGGVTVTPATVRTAGGGDNPEELELKIKEKKAQLEQEIADTKQKAMQMEQEFQRKSLENDLKRQKIAAETAVFEAKAAQLAAQKSKLDAESALKTAIAKKDDIGIESAKAGIQIAESQIALSNERLNNAIANLSDQDTIAADEIQSQKISQQTAFNQLQTDSAKRQRAAGLDLASSGGAYTPPDALGEQLKQQLYQPGSNALTQQLKQQLQYQPDPSFILKYGNLQPQIPTNNLNAPSPQNYEQNAASSSNLAAEVQRLIDKVTTLANDITALAARPSVLQVSTPQPVKDAADIYSKISRNAVRGSGL
ncbi:tape measure protein [Nostoc sp. UHCC 0702]|nr:tape measure protein [Nostoc sp. UHCC 0702]